MLTRIFPFLLWFKNYNSESLRNDAISGLTVALVLIPQSMAYAQLAGLPPYYGLYASFLPPIVAALFGSSRQLATGPVAVVSLMTSASLAPLATAGTPEYIGYAIVLALTVGIFQFSLGLFRLGVVVNFLSHPVINGFTNAAAIIIASSQLSKMFGVHVDSAEHHYETIFRVCKAAFHYTHFPTLFMGILAFGIMYGLRKISPKIPNVLVAVAVTIIISKFSGFEHNIKVNISAIKTPETLKVINEYNEIISLIPSLNKEYALNTKHLEEAKRKKDKIAELDASHQLAVLDIKFEKIKHKAEIYRDEIRNTLLIGIRNSNGSLEFLSKNTDIKYKNSDGKIWRIKAGRGILKTDELTMTGGGDVVGNIPKGLPALTLPHINLKIFLQLFPYAVIISLLGFMEAISIAKSMAAKTGQRLDPNRELIGQGLANIIGSIGKSYPASGSFSRSAVNLQSGAVSGFSSVFTGFAVIVMLIFFTPLLYNLPQSVLAAVIMIAVMGLINVSGFIHAWRAQWYDGAISIITFLSTLVFAPHLDKGIMVGVALSLGMFLYKSMRPNVVSLSRHEDDAYKSSLAHQLEECMYVDLVRFDGTLFFANTSYLEDKINERLMNKKELRHIVIAANGISDIDASGEEALTLLINRVRSAGVDISLSGVNEKVMEVLKRTHLLEHIGADHIYPTLERAVCTVQEQAHINGKEKDCPLMTVCRIMNYENK
ncbi:MAG: SulP family inorganic anion transporter [Deltaproteobacteria bacterium]|nr:SulP family inorganic anion transporter [Deltaproteobacteria bacterium]